MKVEPSAKAPKRCTHQVGFNTTLLLKQLLSDNPSSQLLQLPYQVDYTLGFGKNGVRLGLGFAQSVQKTTVHGQNSPRTTTSMSASYRLDYVRNILDYKKFSSNFFIGGIMEQGELSSNTINDQSSIGGPVTKSEIATSSMGYGGELGIQLKYSFNEHIGIGTELPLQVKYTTAKETDKQTITSGTFSQFEQTISDSKTVSTKIFLPTSLFLCIKF